MHLCIHYAEEYSTLYESVKAHALHLRQMLASPASLDGLRVEVENLNSLLSSFTYTNEWMQQLLDCDDERLRHERRRAALRILRLRGILQGREPLLDLRDLSNETICRVLALLKQARSTPWLAEKELQREVEDAH